MDFSIAATQLASLGHEMRLRIFHALIQAVPSGLSIGQIQSVLDRPLSTVSFHLRLLVEAGLIRQVREGRSVICHAQLESLREMMHFVNDACCQGLKTQSGSEDAV